MFYKVIKYFSHSRPHGKYYMLTKFSCEASVETVSLQSKLHLSMSVEFVLSALYSDTSLSPACTEPC